MALPPTIQTIVGLIGHGKTMELVRELGGQDFRFPIGRESSNWEHLVELVGERAASRLCAHFNGVETYIALCKRAVEADQKRRMINRYNVLLKDGHSTRGAVSILVREFGPISNRTVEKIVNGPMPDQVPEMVAQGSLF